VYRIPFITPSFVAAISTFPFLSPPAELAIKLSALLSNHLIGFPVNFEAAAAKVMYG